MSEEQIFATLGFSEEASCSKAQVTISNLIENNSEYETIFTEVIDPENFVDQLMENRCRNTDFTNIS